MAEFPTGDALARGTRIELDVTGIPIVNSIVELVFEYFEKERKPIQISPPPSKKNKSHNMLRRRQQRC